MILPYLALWQQLTADSWLRALTALIITALLIPLTLPLATRLGLIDQPGGRKQHAAPTPALQRFGDAPQQLRGDGAGSGVVPDATVQVELALEVGVVGVPERH